MAALLETEATINQHIAFVAPDMSQLRSRFLVEVLNAAYAELRRQSDDMGSTRGALTCEDLKAFRLPLPPISIQEHIVRWIRAETATADAAIDRAGREIELLREFKTRLMADVVTGQVDVREIAATLPDIDLAEAAESVSAYGDDELEEVASDALEGT